MKKRTERDYARFKQIYDFICMYLPSDKLAEDIVRDSRMAWRLVNYLNKRNNNKRGRK